MILDLNDFFEFGRGVYVTTTPEETDKIAEILSEKLSGNELIAFFGELGAGKTRFITALCKSLGVNDWVTSPTFTIMHQYNLEDKLICHFDMYRISTFDDLFFTGFFEYINENLCLIEWSENIKNYLPDKRINVIIEIISENSRKITIERVG